MHGSLSAASAQARCMADPVVLRPCAGDTFRWVSTLSPTPGDMTPKQVACEARSLELLRTNTCVTLVPHPAPGASVAHHRRVVRPGAGAAAEGSAGGADAQARGHMARGAAGARHQGAPRSRAKIASPVVVSDDSLMAETDPGAQLIVAVAAGVCCSALPVCIAHERASKGTMR